MGKKSTRHISRNNRSKTNPRIQKYNKKKVNHLFIKGYQLFYNYLQDTEINKVKLAGFSFLEITSTTIDFPRKQSTRMGNPTFSCCANPSRNTRWGN